MIDKELISKFLEHLKNKGYQKRTITKYHDALKHYTAYMNNGVSSIFNITSQAIAAYYTTVKKRDLDTSTIYINMYAVYRFYEWLKVNGYILLNPCTKPKVPTNRRLPRQIPSVEMLKSVYKTLHESSSLWEQRAYYIIDLAYSCGLRRGELQRLDINDIYFDEGILRVKGKFGKIRFVPIGKHTLDDLHYYIEHIRPALFKNPPTQALFISMKKGTRIRLVTAHWIFQWLRRRYKFDRSLHAHALRHAFATDLLRNGAPVQDVSAMLGHSNLQTTQIYTHLTIKDLRDHHAAYHPRK